MLLHHSRRRCIRIHVRIHREVAAAAPAARAVPVIVLAVVHLLAVLRVCDANWQKNKKCRKYVKDMNKGGSCLLFLRDRKSTDHIFTRSLGGRRVERERDRIPGTSSM